MLIVAVVISIWVLSAFLPFLMLLVAVDIYSLIIAIIGVVGAILTTTVSIKIYLPVRRHKNQIQVLHAKQVAQAVEVEFFLASLNKSAVSLLHVCLVVSVCYLPYLINLVPRASFPLTSGQKTRALGATILK